MMRLDHRLVLLTGALGSLGRAQALHLARAGARLLLLDRDATRGATFATTLGAETEAEVRYIHQDLADLQGAQENVAALAVAEGGIDVLINNAALIVNRPFQEFSLAEYEDQIRVNSSAAFALTQAVAPGMIARKYGKIINFCSITLNGRWSGYVPYVASKGAMLGLTKTLARELGPHGVTVNAISPGAIVSEAEERVFGERLKEYNDWILESQCLKRRGQPDDIARLVLFLASSESDFITGQNIAIDGGW